MTIGFATRRLLFLAPPATGELQPIYAIIERLLEREPDVEIHIGSGSTFAGRFKAFRASLPSTSSGRLFRADIGTSDDVEDYSKGMLAPDSGNKPHLFGSHRHRRGDPRPFLDYWGSFAAGSEAERLETCRKVKMLMSDLRPSMVIVDQIYGTPFDAVRSTGLPFIVVAPSHPSFSAADPNPLTAPISMSGIVWRESLANIIANFYTIFWLATWTMLSDWSKTTLWIRRKHFGFKRLSLPADASITPPPGLVNEVCSVISCNIPDLHFYKSFHPKIKFTGPCYRAKSQVARDSEPSEVQSWLDEALMQKEPVIFVTFGSMFPFDAPDYRSMIKALKLVHKRLPHVKVLWKIVRTPDNHAKEDLHFVKETGWLPSVEEVYEHSAVQIVVHHGGGNTVNEVIYHGLRHLAIPQWSDTYDWAATIEGFGLGRQTSNPGPRLESEEIAKQLLHLLEHGDEYRGAVGYWQRRSRASGGTEEAVDLISQQTSLHEHAYARKVY